MSSEARDAKGSPAAPNEDAVPLSDASAGLAAVASAARQEAVPTASSGALFVIALILILAVLRTLSTVVLPLVLAFFVAVLVAPLLDKLRKRIPDAAAIGVALTLIVAAILTFAWAVTSAIGVLTRRSDFYGDRLRELTVDLDHRLEPFGISVSTSIAEPGQLLAMVGAGLQSAATALAFLGFLLFVIWLLLLEISIFQRKLRLGLPPDVAPKAMLAFENLSRGIRVYFAVYTFVSALTGVCTWLFLTLMGVDFALVWGGLAFLLNYIPNIGSVVAVIPPIVLAFLQFDGVTKPLVVLFGLGIIQNVIGSYLAPRMLGKSISLSPLVVLLSVLFWGWYWGGIGLFLAVPLTLTLRILFEHIERLRFVAVLIGDGRELGEDPSTPTSVDDPNLEPAAPQH